VGVADGVNFVGGTFSPRTQPSVDDNGWSPFQLANSTGFMMPLESPYSNQYSKGALEPNTTVIVDDGERLLTDLQRPPLSSFHRLRHSISYSNNHNNHNNKYNGWQDSAAYSPSFVPTQFPISPPLEAQSETNSISIASSTMNQQWFSTADTPLTNLSENFPILTQDLSAYNESQPIKPEPQTKSPSPSTHSNGIDSYAAIGNSDMRLSAENSVKEEPLQIVEWDEPASMEKTLKSSPEFPKVSAFMVSQDASDIPQMSLEHERSSISSTSHSGSRHTPLALQPASVVRRRKQRDSIVNVEQLQQPRPLQIVQEDGLGGAISSEDFVSPPRGARRKGPLSTVGRANAGLRRKNKDTCVQCRLNKRKVC
jgi:hypothetical protein